MTQMGFEPDRNRIQKQSYGTSVTADVGGKTYNFPSLFEWHWAKYLQFLQDHDEIDRWVYQPIKWDFREFTDKKGKPLYKNKPYVYTPDFLVVEPEGDEIYQETKGYITTYDISRIRRAHKHYGPLVFDLVMQRVPRRGKHSQVLARASDKAYIRRIVDASEIFKQMRGML